MDLISSPSLFANVAAWMTTQEVVPKNKKKLFAKIVKIRFARPMATWQAFLPPQKKAPEKVCNSGCGYMVGPDPLMD